MLLKKLEAYGFKSFADRLSIEFGPGITAIVGPNGSGKSNITEAIRWVLGEQSAKNLRGHKMEDVIFLGSERRKPLGIAEVSLTLDNYDHKLPLEFSEITITRRVFRSGESEFFINKIPCRLKDICELFSDTGLGREAMSVISQNQVDEILNNRPEDRRAVFEEAAGITKYKNRKREAVRRLEETQQNLLRVRDILSELEQQITPLAEAAAQTEQYISLEKKFKVLEVKVLCEKIKDITDKMADLQSQCDGLEDELSAVNALMAKNDVQRETAQYNLGILENRCQEIEHKLNGWNLEIRQLESNVLLARERTRNYQEKQQRLCSEIGEYEAKMTGLEQEIVREQTQTDLIRRQLTGYQEQLLGQEKRVTEIHSRVEEGAKNLADSKDAVLDRLHLLAKQRNNLHSARTEAELARRSREKLRQETAENQQAIEGTVRKQKDCAAEIREKQDLRTHIDGTMENKRKAYALLMEEQQQVSSLGEDIQKKLHSYSSRQRVLMDMQKAFEGYHLGVKAVMSHRDAPWSRNVCGIVADLLQVPAEYALAIEIALGGALQNIIVEDAVTAKAAITFLKKANQGRATFLPLDVIKTGPPRDYEVSAAHADGSLGFAAELVTFDAKYKTAIDSLLGRIIIARNMDAALSIARKSGFRARIVTLEGDVISPGGAMTGGSHNKKGSGLLGRRREVEELQAAIVGVQREWEENRQQLNMLAGQTEALTAEMRGLQEERQQLELALATLEKEDGQLTEEKNRLEKMRQVLSSETNLQNRTLDDLQVKINHLEGEISTLEASDRKTQAAIEIYQREVEEQQSALQQVTAEMTETKIRLAAVEQEEITARRMIERLCQLKAAHQEEKQVKMREVAENERALAELAAEIESGQKACAEVIFQRDDQHKVLEQCKTDRHQIVADVNALEKNSRDLRRQNQDLQAKLHELQIKQTHCSYESETKSKYLWENYGLVWDAVKSEYAETVNIEEAEEKLGVLREEMKAMGPVNMGAVAEYERVCQRFEFLSAQAQDLEQAQVALLQVISEMDSTMRKQFMEAFQAIDRHFSTVFQELFEGGHAQLQLTNKEDVLETGVEIIAQPPGKKLQNLSLLSGGERALTVISLLFAMLRTKPTPFCVVDEIDAALDEANVNRFAQFLRNLADHSQFIVITHRKSTMEYANVMHGITMEEQGVSKLLSVKFMEQAG